MPKVGEMRVGEMRVGEQVPIVAGTILAEIIQSMLNM